tara:strand:+ start:3781 stop:3957 length:177 start_codon:yes stop_codon:yes gene_type:complete
MNPILLVIRLFLSVKSFQAQVNEEAEDFDQAIERQKQESQTRRQYRQRRKNSPFLHDH